VYDSYHIPAYQWSDILGKDGADSLRNTNIDAIFLGLWLDSSHGRDLLESGFDGIYTYFASDGFSYGSTIKNFPYITKFCRKNNLICNLSVGPGYDDTKIRPWNSQNSKSRNDGKYYKNMFEKAIDAKPNIISITSFNEWGEGTQIEPAVEKEGFLDYGDGGTYKYIDITKEYVSTFKIKRDEL
jgi:glycoprotein endo-alpha-1,2-mannosidase